MRSLAAALIITLATTAISHGRTFSCFAQSGVTSSMYTYHSFNDNGTSKGGVVKVLAKPKHERVKHFSNTSAPGAANHPCHRIQMDGFQVTYTSAPGYRGLDSFVLEYSRPNQPRLVDEFSVEVK